ncbi:DNA repair protein RecO [Candidatus Giovannonibacteria bacterium RIFCSPLOWO2_12_FULL_44_25]|uniref:DNA repair protein RecO n=3 Tax=Parcubacteria group TaxID=1794811 RepID=A0A1F5W924_9BACT|nr:MAG: DNA repair protein RecO [Candidatus Giovannonibacteria bacterium GWA2_45_15]OGF59776.1 MAG: DNA repair protein RecO [Candidatus Giovannonibacteria bacterium RIFCSPHIGHO2_01_45_12]OGF60982.1 MAG: DNA repair protein RecO [Candidatus Giovannonibacteria bacterium RIFCSPHIGHO2_01_FULL_44_100]OGF72157.1 MAG: DNA repair protein RecO [Candidatus Giovannonibacteria bacterium RIFCSPHIGHO2_02_FULL_45_40]OGF84548.1 MAG: DNA repair protein RecO [Candidatus Giovannonibacteria bacterium RIFCSPLOWO2_01
MPSAYFKTEGLIMKKTPYGEADFLVRALTKDFGKMDALAKGARKTASKLNAHLDILNHTRLQFVKNGERMPTMTDAEVISGFGNWFLDANRISTAGRILKTIDLVVLPGAKDEELFSMAIDFFQPDAGQPLAGTDEERALQFLREFFAHEGYGDSLPEHHNEAILTLWPHLKN